MSRDPRTRHEVTSSVAVGVSSSSGIRVETGDGEVRHISGDVEIQLSGSTPGDRPYTYELVEAIEHAVIETIEDFDGGGA